MSGDSLEVFSNSRLSTWHRCQTLHEYVYTYGKLAGENKQMRKGIYIHEMLEQGYQYYLDETAGRFTPLPDSYLNYICTPNYDEDDLSLRVEAGNIVRDYFNLYAPYVDQRIQILAVEEEIRVPLVTPKKRTVTILMYLDLLYRSIDDGRMYVMDHKSGKMLTKDEVAFMTQQHLYVTMLREHGYHQLTDAVINNIYGTFPKSAKYINDRFRRIPVGVDETKGKTAYVNTGRIIDEIIDKKEAPGSIYLQMDTGCAYCPFHMVCDLRIQGKPKEAKEVLRGYKDKEDSAAIRRRERDVLMQRFRARKLLRPDPAPVDDSYSFEEDNEIDTADR